MSTAIQPASSSRIADYMSRALHSIDIDATLKQAGGLLQGWYVGSLVVRYGFEPQSGRQRPRSLDHHGQHLYDEAPDQP